MVSDPDSVAPSMTLGTMTETGRAVVLPPVRVIRICPSYRPGRAPVGTDSVAVRVAGEEADAVYVEGTEIQGHAMRP